MELFVLGAADEQLDISSFPLAQAQDDVGVDDDDDEAEYDHLARAAGGGGGGGGYMEEADHLLSYHSSSSAADVEVDMDVDVDNDAVSLLMPELDSATALDCGNFVDYDEFNLCLNNILSEEDDDSGGVGGGGGNGNSSGSGIASKHQHQQWRDASDVLNIVQLNNDLGLSFQEFVSETTADEQRSVSSSSPQLA
ncbi:uncharacterized protein LOC111073095 [Drosophila obscura]|uniref:uncharacterized protein LOC111073095 n=1 Tax=Drosophila obscura TaxID=7282 RepID=UPI001BB2004F|nr:uncharacterized protein LOC111073095 [Drosophila obscura]